MGRKAREGQQAFDWEAQPVHTCPAESKTVQDDRCPVCKGPHVLELTREELKWLIADKDATPGMRARWEAKLGGLAR